MVLLRSWNRQPLPTMVSQVALAAPMVVLIWYRLWGGSLLLSNPCHPQELARIAMCTLNHTMLRTRTTCTISKTNRSAAQIVRNRITTTPTSRGWPTICGLHRSSRSATPTCITSYLQVEKSRGHYNGVHWQWLYPVFYTKILLLLVLSCFL
jgi:hypothetical protein